MLDQSSTSRCVAFSAAETVWTRLRELGLPAQLLDIRALYILTQRWEQQRVGARLPIEDTGLIPLHAVSCLEQWGTTSLIDTETDTLARELDPARVLEDIYVDDVVDAASHRVTGWHRIQDYAHTDVIVERAKAFAFAGFPGMAGFDLDAPFMDYERGVWNRDRARGSEGLHMMSGPYAWDDYERAFLFLNHWSASWGESGFVWVGYDTFGSSYVSDRYHLDVAEAS